MDGHVWIHKRDRCYHDIVPTGYYQRTERRQF